MSGASTIRAYG
jgi:hypothetical protein